MSTQQNISDVDANPVSSEQSLEKSDGSAIYLVVISACLLVVMFFIWQFPFDWLDIIPEKGDQDLGDEKDVRGALGALGDYFGGLLNPFLTFASIVLLIHTIRLTQQTNKIAQAGVDATKAAVDQSVEMLDLTRKQVELSVEEMALTRKELEGAKAAQESIAHTQQRAANLQSRLAEENDFFRVLEIHNSYLDQVLAKSVKGSIDKLDQSVLQAAVMKLNSGGQADLEIRIKAALAKYPVLQQYLGILERTLEAARLCEHSHHYASIAMSVIPYGLFELLFLAAVYMDNQLGRELRYNASHVNFFHMLHEEGYSCRLIRESDLAEAFIRYKQR